MREEDWQPKTRPLIFTGCLALCAFLIWVFCQESDRDWSKENQFALFIGWSFASLVFGFVLFGIIGAFAYEIQENIKSTWCLKCGSKFRNEYYLTDCYNRGDGIEGWRYRKYPCSNPKCDGACYWRLPYGNGPGQYNPNRDW